MTPLARSHAHALPEEPQAPVPQETAHGEYGQHGQHSMRAIALRAGLAALALSVAVSGAAYAAVRAGEPSRTSGVEAAAKGTDGLGAEGGRSRVSVTPSTQKVTTETVDATDPHGSVQQESGDLSEGETKVATAGVDGVVRTTYEVTTVGGKEVSRTPVAQVVVTKKVDEVVLVGTGEQQDQQAQQAQQQAAQQAQSAGDGQAAQANGGSESSNGSTPAPAANPGAGTDPDSAKAIARSMMASHGWGDSEFSCLESLWTRESSWNYQAENASSGAYGIPQALPGTKMSEVADDWATNPTTQITWGLNYISGRYGTPCSAWAHSESVGWY